MTVSVAPLSGKQKLEMTSMVSQDAKGLFRVDRPAQEHYLVKHSVKEIEGVKDNEDKEYVLAFDGEILTDECAEELLGFLVNTYFTPAYTQVMRGLLGEVINPYNDQVIVGVSVERLIKEEDEKK